MNILLITPHLNKGGVPRYIIELAKGLKLSGVNVTVASGGGEWLKDLIAAEIRHLYIPLKTKFILSPQLFFSLCIILRFFKENKTDVVHTNARVGQALGTLLKLFTAIPHVTTYHGYYKPHFFRRLLRLNGDENIAISIEIKNHVINDLRIPRNKVHIVYNGIDTSVLAVAKLSKQKAREICSIDTSGPVFGIIARLVEEKNHVLLIDAFKLLAEQIPASRLIIYGTGRLLPQLTEKVKNMGLSGRILFRSEEDISVIYSALDVFVLPSAKEGFGLTILEAQAFGIPVIGSRAGGIKEVILDGRSGIIFKDMNKESLYNAMIEMLESQEKCVEYRMNAFRRIEEIFSLKKMIEGTINVYTKAYNNSRC